MKYKRILFQVTVKIASVDFWPRKLQPKDWNLNKRFLQKSNSASISFPGPLFFRPSLSNSPSLFRGYEKRDPGYEVALAPVLN